MKTPKEDRSPLFDMSDKELINFANKTHTRTISDTVAPEMMRRLKISIEEFNKNSRKQSGRLYWLTTVMVGVALLQLVILFIKN